MRGAWLVALPAVLAACAVACERPEPGDTCEAARQRFAECGATLPLLDEGPCTGVRRATAECIVDHVADCDELATLPARIDACIDDLLPEDDGELPTGGLPVPATAAGAGGSAASAGGGGSGSGSVSGSGSGSGGDAGGSAGGGGSDGGGGGEGGT